MKKLLTRLIGSRNERYLKSIQPLVDKINGLEEEYQGLKDSELAALTDKFKKRLSDGESLERLLPEAFAAVREASRRSLGMRHYDVQLIGGIILHQGSITEMKTGEGKTLVATLPSYLNALAGKGAHVVTVNDYLAQRDAEWMAPVFEKLGMTCKAIHHGLTADERREAYNADVTYATNNELGFDHLRDNMAFTMEQRVQREPFFAVVDEVDSILIDEARTPLIISGPTQDKTELYKAMNGLIPRLEEGKHYEKDEKNKTATLTEVGTDTAEEFMREVGLLQDENSFLYDMENVMLVHHLNQALRAHVLFKKDVDYIIKDDQVVIIDEFTGRMMPGRRFGEGLHQAIEAREGVTIQNENQTLASITFQNYFRLYEKLSGMTGTADTEAEEFESIYGLRVVVVPTNVPVTRVDEADIIYRTVEEKYDAIVRDIRECHERKQPVLVGTTSIEKSEQLSEVLTKCKVKHNVLNARHHEKEAEIIAQAGRLGAITLATNMAGRGVDIKLGGNLEMMLEGVEDKKKIEKITDTYKKEKEQVIEAGGLRVIGTERHESRRIDNQLRGRSGRQGDQGSSVFYLSLQDDLMRIFAPGLDKMMERLDMPSGEAIQSRLVSGALEKAQRKLEGRNFDMRKNLLKFDDVLNDQRKVVYAQRLEIMSSETVDDIILEFREELLEDLSARCFPTGIASTEWQIDTFKTELHRLYDITPDIDTWVTDELSSDGITAKVKERVESVWASKEERMTPELLRKVEKGILLQVLDQQWKTHLQQLDFLKQGIHLRGYGQKDPLNEFKKEGFSLFSALFQAMKEQTVMMLSRVEVEEDDKERILAGEISNQNSAQEETDPFSDDNIGRNEACPCGSGKKYKHCHGQLKAAS
jgi:preprotein translocase subunit SecA